MAASKQCSHGGSNDADPKSTLGAFLGGKRISSGPVLWPGLIVMAAAQEVFWSTPPGICTLKTHQLMGEIGRFTS